MPETSISPNINFGNSVSLSAESEVFSLWLAVMHANSVFNASDKSWSIGHGILQTPKSDGFIDGNVDVLCSANCCIFSIKLFSVRQRYKSSLLINGWRLLITANPVEASIFSNGSVIIPKWCWFGRTVEKTTSFALIMRLALLGNFSVNGLIHCTSEIMPSVMLLVSR